MNHVTVDGICYDKPVNNANEPFITISLSKEAAQALIEVCGVIGGSPTNSDRKYTEAIECAIKAKGLNCIGSTSFETYAQSLYFKDYPEQ